MMLLMWVSGAVRLPPVPLAVYFSVKGNAAGALALTGLVRRGLDRRGVGVEAAGGSVCRHRGNEHG